MSSVSNTAADAIAPFDDETSSVNVRYSFKLTEENKSGGITIALNERVRGRINEWVARSARWKSLGQFVNDALVYYLNQENSTEDVRSIVEESTWSNYHQLAVVITPTLFREIDILVNHGHTVWNTKQEFYICALYSYINAKMPVVVPR